MSNGLDEIKIRQMQQVLTQLGAFLCDSELQNLGIDENINKLTGMVRERLTKLNWAWDSLKRLESRDRFGDDPSLRGERSTYWEAIADVKTSFDFDLTPAVKKLYARLKDRADGQELAESLGQILNQFPKFGQGEEKVSKSSPRSAVDPMTGGTVDSQKSAPQVPVDLDKASQLPRDERLPRLSSELGMSSESPMVPVSRVHVTKLHEHQIKLDNYVKGYIASHELLVLGTKIVHRLEYGKMAAFLPEITKDEYWQEIKNLIERASPDDVVPATLLEEFHASVRQMKTALEKVNSTVDNSFTFVEDQDSTSISKAVKQACREMQSVVNSVDFIANRCRDNAKTELSHVSEEVEQILETFMEAGKFQLQPGRQNERSRAPKLAAVQGSIERNR